MAGAPSASGGTGDATGGRPAPLFGLNAAEMELLSTLLGEMTGRIGLDGDRILDGLGRGETLSQVLNLPPRFGEVLYGRAHTWFAAGRLDRAETLFRVLCVIDGRSADHWVGYGVCLRRRDAWAEAALAFATAAAVRPDWAVPHFHAADLAAAQGQWALAEDHLAAFASRADAALPDPMLQEAAKLRRALALRADLRARAQGV